MKKLVVLELNELNINYVQKYISRGKLPNFKNIITDYGIAQTTSEQKYEELEPWIQWVTAHTGLTYAEHKIFRLGDCVNHSYDQIWEKLEREKQLKVGAISPFNAKNNLHNSDFFIPDPWTRTDVSGNFLDKLLSDAVHQTVNDNAQSKISIKSLFVLVVAIVLNARFVNYLRYFRLALGATKKHWNKAMFLDLLLFDVYLNKLKGFKPDFSSLFLNAGAHIQHHYMFSSTVYDGQMKNPEWYVAKGLDPIFEIYELYDAMIGQLLEVISKQYRLMVMTGLHQDPYPETLFYYRLKDHSNFLNLLNIKHEKVEPRMSRDFLISFKDEVEAKTAEDILLKMKSDKDHKDIFSVDNRGKDLFVMLEYGSEIGANFTIKGEGTIIKDFADHVAFVAIKNGGHNGIGYFIDSGSTKESFVPEFPLKDVATKIYNAFS